MGNDQKPFDEPLPAAQVGIEAALKTDRVAPEGRLSPRRYRRRLIRLTHCDHSRPAANPPRTSPASSKNIDTGTISSVAAPPTISAVTPALASAFMITTVHSPRSNSQVSVWDPGFGGRGPESLLVRCGRRRLAFDEAVFDVGGIGPDPGHLRQGHPIQVCLDFCLGSDTHNTGPPSASPSSRTVASRPEGAGSSGLRLAGIPPKRWDFRLWLCGAWVDDIEITRLESK